MTTQQTQAAPRRRGIALDVRLGGATMMALPACLAALACSARALRAQACERVSSRTSLDAFAGEPITRVDVATDDPLGGRIASHLGWLHVKSRASALRQRVLVKAGEPLDTTRVAESLRRLRRLRALDDVSVTAERCEGVDGVALTFVTHDAWSISPDVRLASAPPAGGQELGRPAGMHLPNGMLALEERNFLGTGRELRGGLETRDGRFGGSMQFTDPLVAGRPLIGRLRIARLPNENAATAVLRSDERMADAAWRGQLAMGRVTRWPMFGSAGRLDRGMAQGLVSRRVSAASAGSALFVGGGFEMGAARQHRFDGARTPGPATVERSFIGLDLGVERVAARYTPNTWLLSHGAVYDVPRGFELSASLGLGRERTLDAPAAHLDSWIGRVWQPTQGALLSTDLWSSGYLAQRNVTAGVLRLSASGLVHAAHGTWALRLASERLSAADPDVRPLFVIDPTARMLAPSARLAGTMMAGQLERALRFDAPVGHAAFDVAAFAAGSVRRSPCEANADVGAAAIGFGLRAVPLAAGRSALRLNYVVPVAGSAGTRRTPYVMMTFAPAFGADRLRDMLRTR